MPNAVELFKNLDQNYDNLPKDEQKLIDKWMVENIDDLAKKDFYAYVRRMAGLMLPNKYIDGKHIHLYCRELQSLERSIVNGKGEKVQLWLPPGSMKSMILNLFVTWCFGRHPYWQILHIGHTIKFAEDNFGKNIQDLMRTPEYRNIFPDTKIDPTSKAKGLFKTTKKGKYHCTGVGNAIAGKRGNLTICDDVISEQTTKKEMQTINEWYIPGLRSRLLPGGGEVIVNTRWAVEDLSGFIINVDAEAGKAWRIIKIPAILDNESAVLVGGTVGESFWPEFWPTEVFKQTQRTAAPYVWNALYMQNPVPDDGNIFKAEHIEYWDNPESLPEIKQIVLSFDTAFSTNQGADYSGYTVWGVFDQKAELVGGKPFNKTCMLLLEANKGRWTFPELRNKIVDVYNSYGDPDYIIIENKASGQSIIQDLQTQGFPVVPYTPDRDKESRAHAATSYFANRTVYIPKNVKAGYSWVEDYILELLQFPNGAHDDMVDCTTQAILWLRDAGILRARDEQYKDRDEDSEKEKAPRKTYWNAVRRRT